MDAPLDCIMPDKDLHPVMILALKKFLLELILVAFTQILYFSEDINQDRDIVIMVEQEVVMVVEEVLVPEVDKVLDSKVEVVLLGISQVKFNFYPVRSYPRGQDKVVMLVMHFSLLKDMLQQMIKFLSYQIILEEKELSRLL